MEKRGVKRSNEFTDVEASSRRRSNPSDSLAYDLVCHLRLCQNQHSYREATLSMLAPMTWTFPQIKSFMKYGGISALCELFKSTNYDFIGPLLALLQTIMQSSNSLLSSVVLQIVNSDVVLLLRDLEKNRHTQICYPAYYINRHLKHVEIDIQKLKVPSVITTPSMKTYHVSHQIGKGSFGKVFQGRLAGGQVVDFNTQ